MTLNEYNKAVDHFADNLYRFILKNCRNEEMAQDVVQDTFEKLWVKMDQVDGKKVKSYLFSAGYHTMLDIIKKEKRLTALEQPHEKSYSHDEHYSDMAEVLQEALARLPEKQRSVIMLRDYEGYSYEEIGEITGLNESQVKVYIYRGRISLKKYLVKIDHIL